VEEEGAKRVEILAKDDETNYTSILWLDDKRIFASSINL